MSESDECSFGCSCIKCKGKKRVIQIEETSDSDSPIESLAKRKKVARVVSDVADSSSCESEDINFSARRKKLTKVPRMSSDEDDSSPRQRRPHQSARLESETESDSSYGEDNEDGSEEINSEAGSVSSYDSDYVGEDSDSIGWESDWSSSEIEEIPIQAHVTSAEIGATNSSLGFESDSSDGQSEKCPICLRSFNSQEIGKPESCDHVFCLVCLEEWSRNVNTCPVDRKAFTLIHVSDRYGGKVVRNVAVTVREQQEEDEMIYEDPTFCERCQLSDREDRMLLCDGCDSGYHLDCLDPPLREVPVEQWFCPECVSSVNISGETGIADGELTALIEDAYAAGFPTAVRPRFHRLLPRTRQSERVRATIRSRLSLNQPSTSSGIDSLDSAGRRSRFFGGRPSDAVTVKRRKTIKKKTRKVKRKRKTTTKKTKSSATTGTKKSSTTGTKKRRKTKRKRKYVRKRKVRKPPRIPSRHSVKGRLAEQLGLRPPRNSGQLLPEVKVKPPSQISMPGIPTLHLFGNPDQLDYFSSSSDMEGGAAENAAVGVMSRPRTSAARNERNLANRKLLSPGAIQSHSTIGSDILSDILESQTVWHSKKTKISINRDRSFTVNNDDKKTPLPIASQEPPVNVKDASSAAAKQTPLFPGRGSDGRGRPPGGGFQQFNATHRYNSNSSTFQGGNQSFGPSDFRENRMGYSEYLRGGPMPFRGNSPPVRFRMPQRFPLRPPFQRRLPAPTLHQPTEPKEEERGWKSDNEDDGEDEEIDLYSDIEVGGPEQSEEAFQSLPPPPLPPAQLMGLASDQPASEDDSDTELIIDDKAPSPAAEVPEADKYDPAEPSSDVEDLPNPTAEVAEITLSSGSNSSYPSPAYDDSNSQADLAITKAVQEVLKVHLEASCSANDDRASSSPEEGEETDKCPNFSIYSATSMDIARNTDSELIPEDQGPTSSSKVSSSDKADNDDEMNENHCVSDEEANAADSEAAIITNTENLEKLEAPAAVEVATEKLVAEIFGSDEESLVGGATSPVSAVSSTHTPPRIAQTGLEGLDTEAISETDEAIHFDELSEASFATVDDEKNEDDEGKVEKDCSRDPLDYEEGEIVDEMPKREKKKEEVAKEPEKKVSDENVDTTKKPSKSSEDEKKKKRKRSSDKAQGEKERPILGSKENKEKSKPKDTKSSKDDPSIAWKKPSKAKERNYRDGKEKVDSKNDSKETSKKSSSTAISKEKDSNSSRKDKDRKKKDKRQDMERYNVRKMVTSKKRTKRRDEFGRDLSRDRSYTRTRSRSRGRRSRSVSRTRSNRDTKRSPVKPKRRRSRSISRRRSRTKSRHRSRSKSPIKLKNRTKSKDRLKRSRSRERPRRHSVDKQRSRKLTRSKSRSAKRSRMRSRSRTPVRSRGRVEPVRPVVRARRTLSRSWTRSWSRSGSVTGSSISRSRSSSLVHQYRSYSRSYSRSWTPDPCMPVSSKSAISKTAKKLTVTVTNTKEAPKKKKDKKKKILKTAEPIISTEKRKKRKDKSPAPSKEVFTSGDNILVSVNFNKSSKPTSKDSGVTGLNLMKRSLNSEGGNSAKKLKKDKVKDKTLTKGAKGIQSRLGAKKVKKNSAPKLTRVQAAAKRKPMAIIDLDHSPFREQTPSPRDLIVLSDSDDDVADNKAVDKRAREQSISPKGSSKTGTNTATNVSESQSPVMSNVGSYVVTSTGPKTPPEPQIKFSIAAKTALRSIMNPLQEDDDEEEEDGDEAIMDNIDLRIEEELNRGLGEGGHKGPNTPPEPRGPSTPCFSPSSPDAYDPFDPTKSGTPSPAEPEPEQPSPGPSPAPEPEQDTREDVPKMPENDVAPVADIEQDRLLPDVQGSVDLTAKSPIVVESPLALTAEPPLQILESESPKPAIVVVPEPDVKSPERSVPIVTTPVKQFIAKPVPVSALQPAVLSVPHATVASPVFPALTSANIATMLRTPPPPIRLFTQPPPVLPHHLFMSSPQRPPLTPEKSQLKVKPSPVKPSPQRSTPTKTPLRSQNGDKDKSTDVVDMDLESPYSPASSEANDLFEPPVDVTKHQRMLPTKKAAHKAPVGKNADIFDNIFGASPIQRNKMNSKNSRPAPKPTPAAKKTLLPKKQMSKAKKEIGIKMNEDKLQILDELPSSAVELQVKDKYLKKLNRQERVVEEVKLSLKPHYAKKHITKEEYKDILRRSVPKICHNRSGEINPIKIASLVEAYVKKARYNKKKTSNSAVKPKAKQMWS